MQIWAKKTAATQQFGVLLFDGFSNHCLANTIEPLRAANTLSGKTLYAWQVLTISGEPVESSSGLVVTPHDKLSQARGDTLICMPSYGHREHAGWQSQSALRSAANRFSTLAGFDTGAWLLASAGLLDGHTATIHWDELSNFAERFPDLDVVRERYVVSDDRMTCTGASAAFDLIVQLIRKTHGNALALEVDALFMSHTKVSETPTGSPDKAIAIMQAHLETPLSIGEVARLCGQRQKVLEQRMKAAYGATPRQIYRRLRLNLARKMVQESAMSISEIALRSGYENPSALTRAFKAEFGMPPRALRPASDHSKN